MPTTATANVTSITDHVNGNQSRSMTYDGLDRLKTVTSAMFGSTGANYDYNALDNLTRVRIGGANTRDHFYCYDAVNRLTNLKTGSCSGSTVTGLEYDLQGNLYNKNGQLHDFDYGNRLREVIGVERYRYDANGRRILAMNFASGTITSQYGGNGQLLYQQNARTGENKEIDHIYLAGSLIAQREVPIGGGTATVKYHHTDALGSPTEVTGTGGAGGPIERTEYEPFGEQLVAAASIGNDGPGYTGHARDVATGLSYMQQRYYDPQIGRFLSADPVSATSVGGNFNRYWYASNNPYRFVDPDGRDDVDYFHKDDVLYDAANRFDLPGFTTVMGHSWAQAYQDNRDNPYKSGPSVSYETLKRDIAAAYKDGDYIFLGGCNLGRANVPTNLAKEFNTSVLSANGYVRRSESSNGDITYTVNSREDGKGAAGSFQFTRPDGSTSGSIGSVTMRSDGKAVYRASEAPTGTRIRPTAVVDLEKKK